MLKQSHRHSRPFFETMRGVALFSACNDRELARIGSLVTLIDVPAGRLLTDQGDIGRECFVIVRGETTIMRNGIAAPRPTRSEIIGELALMDHTPRSASVSTIAPTRLLVLSQREFDSLRRLNIESITGLLEETAQAHRAAVQAWPTVPPPEAEPVLAGTFN
jgi:CRP-like cAMP-binding protein